jgi:hypothetical protein
LAIAGALLGLAFGVVLLYAVATQSSGRWTDAPASIVVAGADLIPAQGSGRKDGRSFALESSGKRGGAVLTAKLAPFQAEDFPRVEWTLDSADPPTELYFIWRTQEHPRRSYSKRLQWLVDGVAPLELQADDGWSGTVTGVALLVRSTLAAPLRVGSLRIAAPSAGATANAFFRQWSSRIRLRGYSTAFPFDSERAHYLPLLAAVAIAEGMALLGYWLLARWRGWRRDRRVLWAIFLGGWLLLDLRWQANLWAEVADRGQRFAGKTTEEKHRAADDAVLYVLIDKMQRKLPPPPARVVLYCDNSALCVRAAFFLYPHNVYRTNIKPPDPDELRAGDYFLLVISKLLGYDPEQGLLVWPDGRTRAVEAIYLQPEALLLRLR